MSLLYLYDRVGAADTRLNDTIQKSTEIDSNLLAEIKDQKEMNKLFTKDTINLQEEINLLKNNEVIIKDQIDDIIKAIS